jgi:segregation and condensation protein B
MSIEEQPPVELRQVVEALLFAAPKPLTPRQIVNLLTKSNETHGPDFARFQEMDETRVRETVEALALEYAEAPRGVLVQEVAGGFRFGTRPGAATWVRQLFAETRPAKLSQPALETLAIIAYRQPISRADVEAVRGVAIDGVVTTLLERRLVKLAGRSEAPGRPLLYETTSEFLEAFGLKNLDELPNADELRRIKLATAPAPTPAPAAETPPEVPANVDADTESAPAQAVSSEEVSGEIFAEDEALSSEVVAESEPVAEESFSNEPEAAPAAGETKPES